MKRLSCLVALRFPCLSFGAESFLEEVLVWDFKEGGYDIHHVCHFDGNSFNATNRAWILKKTLSP